MQPTGRIPLNYHYLQKTAEFGLFSWQNTNTGNRIPPT